MGTALTGLQQGSTYSALLKTTANTALDTTLRAVSDGLGNDSSLKLSTTGIEATGTVVLSKGSATPLSITTTTGNPKLTIQGYNSTGATVQTGRLEVIDPGSPTTTNNVVLGAASTGDPNIRLQVDSTAAHIGFNIGGTSGSAVTVHIDSGSHGQVQIRSAEFQSTGTGLRTYLTQRTSQTELRANGRIEEISEGVGSNLHYITAYDTSSGNSGALILRHARGTEASPVALLSGDRLGAILSAGQYSTTVGHIANSAGIIFEATEAWSATNQGSKAVVQTTPNGSTTRATVGTFTSNSLSVGPTGTANINGNNNAVTIQSAQSGSTSASLELSGYRTSDGAIGQIIGLNGSTILGLRNYLRNGADNTGRIDEYVTSAGSLTKVMEIAAGGIDVTGEVRCDSLRIDAAPSASAASTTHKIAVTINGSTYYLLLSNV